LDAIQDEINKTDNKAVASSDPPEEDELGDLHRRLAHANLPNDVVAVAQREIKRIKKLQPSSSEWAVSRNYLEWLADIPWSASSAAHLDISRSKKQLDNDHFG
jgi:ATP-dependent Lon protease